jgi:hypothetical protein
VTPSKVFLWALEKEEGRDLQYMSALQLYEVQISGLKLLHTLSDSDIRSNENQSWISRIFLVTLQITFAVRCSTYSHVILFRRWNRGRRMAIISSLQSHASALSSLTAKENFTSMILQKGPSSSTLYTVYHQTQQELHKTTIIRVAFTTANSFE